MMQRSIFFELEYSGKTKVTRRDRFLAVLKAVTTWESLLAAIEPVYPKGHRGRPPIRLEVMLRMYFAQQWCIRFASQETRCKTNFRYRGAAYRRWCCECLFRVKLQPLATILA